MQSRKAIVSKPLGLILNIVMLAALCVLPTSGSAQTTLKKPVKFRTNTRRPAPINTYYFIIPFKETIAPLDVKKTLAGKFNLASNYMFRGISQTNNLPAAQGGLALISLKTGIYFCIFGSNVDFENSHTQKASAELDPAIGITNKVNDYFSFDINLSRYNYVDAAASNYNELNTYLNFYFLTSQFSYSNSAYATGKSGAYYNLGFQFNVPSQYIFHIKDLNLSGGIGYSSLPKNKGLRDYKDYNLALNKTIGNYIFTIQWTDTDGHSTDARSLTDSHIVGMFSVNF